jgi:uncharacterized protein (TIGR03086 family)
VEPLDYFERGAAAALAIVDRLAPRDERLPTACPAWDVRTVANHLALGGLRTAAWVEGRPALPWETVWLGADLRGGFAESVATARTAFSRPGALDREVRAAFGPVRVPVLIRMLVNEYLAHGWDLADAVGVPLVVDPELAELALADAQARLGALERPPGGPFGPSVPVPEDAPDVGPVDRLVAFLGRRSVRDGIPGPVSVPVSGPVPDGP